MKISKEKCVHPQVRNPSTGRCKKPKTITITASTPRMSVRLPNEIIDRIFKFSGNTDLLENFDNILSKNTVAHLEFLKWMKENGDFPVLKAACEGRTDILKTFCLYGNTLPIHQFYTNLTMS